MGQHDDFECFHPRHDGHREVSVQLGVRVRVQLDYIGDPAQRPGGRDEPEELFQVKAGGEVFSYQARCRVTWCASKDARFGVGKEELKDCFNDCDGFAGTWSVMKR